MARGLGIRVRLTDDEKREIEEAAKRDAMDASTWMRSNALRAARRQAEQREMMRSYPSRQTTA